MTVLPEIHSEVERLANPEKAAILQRFFKTAPGEYGEGDRFVGISVPALRQLARQIQLLPLSEATLLLQSPIHEERLLALLLLVRDFQKGNAASREEIYQCYLGHTPCINNWDLVDVSAEHIVGAHLRNRDRTPLYGLARSGILWERRIAIMSTFHFIKNAEFTETLRVAALLLQDPHDLIHKAVGWMLREIGKRDRTAEEDFLRTHYRRMPRTMLRYALEKFPGPLRQQYLTGMI